MMLVLRILAMFVLVLAAPLLNSEAAGQTVIKMGTIFSPGNSTWLLLEQRLKAVEAETGGAVTFDVGLRSAYGRSTELLGKVENSELDAGYVVMGNFARRFPGAGVLELPLIRRTAVAGTQTLWDLKDEGFLDKDFEGLKVLGMWMLPAYAIMTAERPIEGPRSFRGLKIRSPSPTAGRALQKLGAIPVNLGSSQMGPGLQAGLLDGISYGLFSASLTRGINDEPLINQIQYIADLGFFGPAVALVTRQDFFDGLPEPVKAAIDKHLGRDASVALAEDRDQRETATAKTLTDNAAYTFVAFTPDQMSEMSEAVADVYAEWAAAASRQGLDAQALLARTRELVGQYE